MIRRRPCTPAYDVLHFLCQQPTTERDVVWDRAGLVTSAGVRRACRDRAKLPASGPGFHVQCKCLQTRRIWLEWARLATSGPGLCIWSSLARSGPIGDDRARLVSVVKPGPVGTYRRRPGRACFGTGPRLLRPGQGCHLPGAGAARAWREWARLGASGVAEINRASTAPF